MNSNSKYQIKKLKASSLANAIFVSLLISVFCGCLVLISHYHNLLNQKLYLEEKNIDRNNSSFNYFLTNMQTIEYGLEKQIDVFNDGIYSYGKKKKWGFYDVLISKTIFKNDTINKIALVGEENNLKNNIALYVTNYDKPLKLSGKIKINGDVKIPYGKYESAYINNEKTNDIKIEGKQLKSNKIFPKIKNSFDIDYDNYEPISLGELADKEIINSFENHTKLIYISNSNELKGYSIKGNIIINSKTSIVIDETVNLTDVMIVAPKVFIGSGFSGSLQIVAEKIVEIASKVTLQYPSSIYINNNLDSVSVKVKSNSTLIGGVVITCKNGKYALKRQLSIDSDSKVIGTVYCYGKTELKGNVIGSLYTDRLTLKTNSSYYENILSNVEIDKTNLMKEFVEIPLFNDNNSNNNSYEVIKEF